MTVSNPQLYQALSDAFKRLIVAFPNTKGNPSDRLDVYVEALNGVSLECVPLAATRAIQELEFFPKAAELRRYALDIARVMRPPLAAGGSYGTDWWSCHCGCDGYAYYRAARYDEAGEFVDWTPARLRAKCQSSGYTLDPDQTPQRR